MNTNQVKVQPQMNTDELNFTAEDKFLGCFCVTARYTTKVRNESIGIDSESGCFGVGCCTKTQQRIIPFTSIQSIGTGYGGCHETICCIDKHAVWIATVASGLRFPHYTFVRGAQMAEDIMTHIQKSLSARK
ncbi:hypothetical protein HDV01_004480 [Terramyces sp. JEL0728]|nr:hypothetical protein HDV01_004480 [Terramyces sp. JEL0728]